MAYRTYRLGSRAISIGIMSIRGSVSRNLSIVSLLYLLFIEIL